MKKELIFNKSLIDLKKWMEDNGHKKFRAKQVMEWLYKGTKSFDEMKNIPSKLKNDLEQQFIIKSIEADIIQKSFDGTEKFLFRLVDDNKIESVLMKYKHGLSVCISTQVGCRMGCEFCASTKEGLIRNLSAGEMLEQVFYIQQYAGERVKNIVLMGIGEPFDNFENIISFLNIISSEDGLNIGSRRITLSTCGIIPKMIEFAEIKPQVNLSVSLHAPNDHIRQKIMPIARKYDINKLIKTCRWYTEKTSRRITFEYSLIDGVNDSNENAKELAKLLKGLLCHVNLIPVNVIKEGQFKKSKNIEAFKQILDNNRIQTTIRRELGSDIQAACGQLRRSKTTCDGGI